MMIITEMINKDYKDINSLVCLINDIKSIKNEKEGTSLIAFISELQDVFNLYSHIKEETVYNRLRHKVDDTYDQIILFESYGVLTHLLARCIRTFKRGDTLKAVAQFEVFANLLKFYMEQEIQYLSSTLREYFSPLELETMAAHYEAKKFETPAYLISENQHLSGIYTH